MIKSIQLGFAIILFTLTAPIVFAQSNDSWSNYYTIKGTESTDIGDLDMFKITLNTDVDEKEFSCGISNPSSYIISSRDNDNKIIAKPLIYDLAKGVNEYAKFGWTNLHTEGKIECLKGDELLICKTSPNTIIPINQENYFTKTGMFTIIPDYGFIDINIVIPVEQ